MSCQTQPETVLSVDQIMDFVVDKILEKEEEIENLQLEIKRLQTQLNHQKKQLSQNKRIKKSEHILYQG